jgi:transcriptional regulator with XRE-family HTH domain
MTEINKQYADEVRREIGSRIKGLRKANGLTQSQLADKIGVTKASVSKIERGEWLSAEMLIRLSVELDFSIQIAPNAAPTIEHSLELIHTLKNLITCLKENKERLSTISR